MISLSQKELVFWPVYITIGNLNVKIHQNQNRLNILLLGSISIVHKQTEDSINKKSDLKAKIYHLALETMLKHL